MLIAIAAQQRRFHDVFYRLPFVSRRASARISEAHGVAEDVVELISLSAAGELRSLYPSPTLVARRSLNADLVNEAIIRERGRGGTTVYALYVEERPGLFVGSAAREPDPEGGAELSSVAAQLTRDAAPRARMRVRRSGRPRSAHCDRLITGFQQRVYGFSLARV